MNLPGAFHQPKVFRKRAVISTIIIILDSGLFENWVISMQKYEFCVFLHLNFWRWRAVTDTVWKCYRVKLVEEESIQGLASSLLKELTGLDPSLLYRNCLLWCTCWGELQRTGSSLSTNPLIYLQRPLATENALRISSALSFAELSGKCPHQHLSAWACPANGRHWCQTIRRNRCVITTAGPEQGCVPNNAPFQIYLISKKSCHPLIVLTSPFTISAFLQINTKPDAVLLSLANEYSLSAW